MGLMQARAAGCVAILTRLISQTGDEEVADLAARVVSACSGPLSGSSKVQEVVYGGHVIQIQEGSLGDGLGARIWVAAHTLCREISDNPELVRGLRVLELGAGCGLSGLLAYKLGASEVVLTDYEHKVLKNLRACAAANAATPESIPPVTNGEPGGGARPTSERSTDAQTESSNHEMKRGPGADQLQWDWEGLRVRHLDWAEATSGSEKDSLMREDAIIGRTREPDDPPNLEAGQKFQIIIGSDLLYEVYHGDLVAAVISTRLEAGGRAFVSLAVRRKVHLERLLQQCRVKGLHVSLKQVEVDPEAVGIMGREHEYEGGFVFLTITHE